MAVAAQLHRPWTSAGAAARDAARRPRCGTRRACRRSEPVKRSSKSCASETALMARKRSPFARASRADGGGFHVHQRSSVAWPPAAPSPGLRRRRRRSPASVRMVAVEETKRSPVRASMTSATSSTTPDARLGEQPPARPTESNVVTGAERSAASTASVTRSAPMPAVTTTAPGSRYRCIPRRSSSRSADTPRTRPAISRGSAATMARVGGFTLES